MKTFSLADIQIELQQCLLESTTSTPDWIENQNGLSASARLDIYREAYRLRLIEALAADYSTLKAVVGDEAFINWCDAYIKAHPSRYFSLRYFGQHFSNLLKTNHEPLLAELAQFEWLLSCAFDAEDKAYVTRETLAALPAQEWEMLKLQLHPSAYLVELNSNAPPIWQQFSQFETVGELMVTDSTIPYVLWRQNLKVYFRSLSPHEFTLLKLMQKPILWVSLCETCDQLDVDNSAQHMAQFLNVWVNDGLLI